MLSHQQAKAFYDRFGRKQDWQSFYEDVATEAVIRNGKFDSAEAVFEFGCGTGRFAAGLLERHLSTDARYVGVDISETMVGLAKERLVGFGSRAGVYLSDGSPQLDFPTATFDRFVSNYVFDLLEVEDIRTVLQEAWRILSKEGLLALVSLTHGCTFVSRLVENLWVAVHDIRPGLVGGCRPISLSALVTEPSWRVIYEKRFSRWGLVSESLVAQKTGSSPTIRPRRSWPRSRKS
jgi:ubiquinone/menaquinone biosynthesis C-methylase UbiE